MSWATGFRGRDPGFRLGEQRLNASDPGSLEVPGRLASRLLMRAAPQFRPS